jgi:hypothetical protein
MRRPAWRMQRCAVVVSMLGTLLAVQQVRASGAPTPSGDDGSAASHGALWGIDTVDNVETGGIITQTGADLGTPQFVGRYLIYSSELSSAEAAYIHGKGMSILLIDDPNRSFTSGSADAQQAIAQATALGVTHGTAIFRDVETNDPITSTYIAAYVTTFDASDYAAGFYENAINGPFATAYCAAVGATASIAGHSLLYASEPEHTGSNPRRAAKPAFTPDSPACAHRTSTWQYLERGLFPAGTWPNVDVDEFAARFSAVLW